MNHRIRTKSLVLVTYGVLVLGILFVSYRYYRLRQTLHAVIAASNTATLALQGQLSDLTDKLTASNGDVGSLSDALGTAQTTITDYQGEVQNLSGTVGTLQKLTTIDPELLKKYSKVYFLNEHYIPSSLTAIDPHFLSDNKRTLQIHTSVSPRLQSLLEANERDGQGLRIASAYRSYGTQAQLKSQYIVRYGTTAANRFSAEQGYSEHQLGTTVDFTTAKTGTLTSTFDKSPEYAWLTDNAFRYGFVLSYPKNNKYYVYEPWHWRYVGIALATTLHNQQKSLYDMDQREIDTYLVSIFD